MLFSIINIVFLNLLCVNINDFGAIPNDNKDDTYAIRKAIQYAQDKNIKTIKLGNGVYNIGLKSEINDGNVIIIEIPSNCTIIGSENSIILISNKLNSDKESFIVFGKKKSNVKNVEFRNFTIDYNRENNKLNNKDLKHKNAAIYFESIENLSVLNMKFIGNIGRQTISITHYAKGLRSKNILIQNCNFEYVADGIIGNYQSDHSSIYVEADNVTIFKNSFKAGDEQSKVATAIEIQGSNTTAYNNTIINYNTAINIVASSIDTKNITFENNYLYNIATAAMYWTSENRTLNNVTINNNYIEVNHKTNAVFNISSGMKGQILNATISNNIVKCTYLLNLGDTLSACGINIGPVKTIQIKNNIFENILGRVITFGKSQNFEIEKFLIVENTFNNCTRGRNNKHNKSIQLKSDLISVKNLIIKNNKNKSENNTNNQYIEIGSTTKILSKKIEI